MFLVVSLFDNIQLFMFTFFSEAIIRTSETLASTERIEVQQTPISFSIISLIILYF